MDFTLEYTDIFTEYRVIIVFVHNFGGDGQGSAIVLWMVLQAGILLQVPQGPIAVVYSAHMTIQISNIQLLFNNMVNDFIDAKTA